LIPPAYVSNLNSQSAVRKACRRGSSGHFFAANQRPRQQDSFFWRSRAQQVLHDLAEPGAHSFHGIVHLRNNDFSIREWSWLGVA
jgi:hypothetical protein